MVQLNGAILLRHLVQAWILGIQEMFLEMMIPGYTLMLLRLRDPLPLTSKFPNHPIPANILMIGTGEGQYLRPPTML